LTEPVSETAKTPTSPSPLAKRALVWFFALVLVLALFWLLRDVLLPFVLGTVLAYVLAPVVRQWDQLSKGKMPHVLSVLLVEGLFFVTVLGVLLLLVPILTQEIPLIKKQVPVLVLQLAQWVQGMAATLGISLEWDAAKIKENLMGYLSASGEATWTTGLSFLQQGSSWAMSLLTNLILLPMVVFYLLVDWDRLTTGLMSWVPERLHNRFYSFIDECNHVLGQYLRGQLLEMVILAIFYSTGLWLFGLDLALPIGIFTGLAVCVPYLGYGVGLVLAALAGWLQFDSVHTLSMLVVVYGTGTVLEGFVLTPKLVGKRIGLNPLYVVFALMAFGSLFGLIGVFVALPVSAVLLVAIRRFRQRYLESDFYQDPA